MKKKKISELQTGLTVLFVCCLLISNVITAKQIQFPFGVTMTAAVLVFPITYILSDVFSEVYGYRWSRITCYMGFAMNLLMVLVFSVVIKTPAPDYWKNQEAFETVLGNTPRILFASLFAYVLGDFVNDKVFQKMKKNYEHTIDGFSTRALISSICGELTDSVIFIPIAFFGQMPVKQMLQMIIIQPVLKISYEIIILPITTIIVKKVKTAEKCI